MLVELLDRLFEQEPASLGSAPPSSLPDPLPPPASNTKKGPADHPDVLQMVSALKYAKKAGDHQWAQEALARLQAANNGALATVVNNEIDFEMHQAVRKGGYVSMAKVEELHKAFWKWIFDKVETFDPEKGTFANWIKHTANVFAHRTGWRQSTQPGHKELPDVDPKKYDLPKMEPYTDDERVVASVIHNYLAAVAKGSEPFPYSMKNPTREKAAAFIDMFLSYWGIGTPRLSAPDIVQKYPELVPNRFNLRQLMQTMSLSMKKYVQRAVGRFGVSDPEAAYTQLFQKLSGRNFGSASKTEPSIHAEFDDRMDELLSALTGVFKVA